MTKSEKGNEVELEIYKMPQHKWRDLESGDSHRYIDVRDDDDRWEREDGWEEEDNTALYAAACILFLFLMLPVILTARVASP